MSTMMSTIVYHVDWDLDPLCPQPRLAKVAARRPRAAENALGRTGGWAGSNLTGGFSGGHPNWMGCCWGAYEPLFEIQFLEIPLFFITIPRNTKNHVLEGPMNFIHNLLPIDSSISHNSWGSQSGWIPIGWSCRYVATDFVAAPHRFFPFWGLTIHFGVWCWDMLSVSVVEKPSINKYIYIYIYVYINSEWMTTTMIFMEVKRT